MRNRDKMEPIPGIPKKLQEEYLRTIPQKLQNLKELLQTLQAAPTPQALEALRYAIHKLAGSAGTYGFPVVSKICKQWELDLQNSMNHFPLPAEWLSKQQELLSQIEKAFHG